MDKTLIAEFDALAVKTRTRANSIQSKLTAFLHSEIEAGKDITKVSAADLGVEKIHIQTLYNALKKNGLEVKRGASFVVEAVDAYYAKSAIVKLA